MIGRKTGLAIFLILVLAGSLFAVHATQPTAAVAVPYEGAGAVGALVILDHGTITRPPFCTAAVVRSPPGNLLVTAAHCLGRVPVSAMAFVPDYHGGSGPFPHGLWRVARQTFPALWFPNGNINTDFAFLTVRGDVQAKVGAEILGASSPAPASVQVIGYTLSGQPVTCTRPAATIAVSGQRQLKFTCDGYEPSASGAPFLVNVSAQTGNGTIIGVIGGYEQGGHLPSILYSSPFGANVKTAFHMAQHPPPTPTWYKLDNAVGALIIRNPHKKIWPAFCTASVVNSPAGNVLVTAAHCLGRVPVKVMAFVPGYRPGSGPFPYGLWPVTKETFPPHWFPNGNVNTDFAFLTVRGDVQARVGAETLGASSPPPKSVQVIGYTSSDTYPLTCTRPPTTINVFGQKQFKFVCDGYIGAASGAPFLVNVAAKTGNGTIIGVIGGYQEGGNLPWISYSTPFGAKIKALYKAVTRKG